MYRYIPGEDAGNVTGVVNPLQSALIDANEVVIASFPNGNTPTSCNGAVRFDMFTVIDEAVGLCTLN